MVGPRGYYQDLLVQQHQITQEVGALILLLKYLYDVMKGYSSIETTIADLAALEAAGEISYTPANQDTGYFLKKFMPLKSDITTGGGDPVLNFAQNVYILRLADTYLLEAEALGGNRCKSTSLIRCSPQF